MKTPVKKTTRLCIILTFILLFTGCALPPKKHAWNPHESKALNISKHAGIDGLTDTEIPNDIKNSDAFRAPGALIYGLSGYKNPTYGFTDWGSAGMNIASIFLSPTARSKRNSFFIWDDSAVIKEDLYKNFIAAFENAKEGYLTNNGKYKIKSGYRAQEKEVLFLTLHPSWYMNLSGPGCTTEKTEWGCSLGFNIKEPRMAYNPRTNKLSLHTDVSNSHQYSNFKICLINEKENKFNCSYFDREKINNGFNEVEFLLEFSKHLPVDYYFYAAPKKIFLSKENPAKIPVIINNGESLYFIKP